MTLGNDNGTDGQTDRQTDRQSATQYAAPPREEGRIIIIIIIITSLCGRDGRTNNTYVFVPVAIETGGTWHHQAVELVQEIGRRTANITGDVTESNFLFQQLSVALQRGDAVLISKHVHHQLARCNPLFHIFSVLVPTGFVLVGQKKKKNCYG